MHADNIHFADQLAAWRSDPANKKTSVAGDDRSPAWSWLGYIYTDGRHIVLPSDNLARCFMEGATMVPVPGGKGQKTFKAQSMSGMLITGDWRLLVDGDPIPVEPLDALLSERDFVKHNNAADALGFSLFVKRAKVGQSKHVRVRPRFDRWSARGTIRVIDEQITAGVLANILKYAGAYRGLGDWRPSSKTPGAFGMFSAEIHEH